MKGFDKSKYVLKESLTEKEKEEIENRFLNSKNSERLTIYQVLQREKQKHLEPA